MNWGNVLAAVPWSSNKIGERGVEERTEVVDSHRCEEGRARFDPSSFTRRARKPGGRSSKAVRTDGSQEGTRERNARVSWWSVRFEGTERKRKRRINSGGHGVKIKRKGAALMGNNVKKKREDNARVGLLERT